MPQIAWWQLSSERKWFLPSQRWQVRSKVITLFTLVKALLLVKVKKSDGFSCAHLFWSPSTWLQIGDAAQDRCSHLSGLLKSQLISGSGSKWNSWGILENHTGRAAVCITDTVFASVDLRSWTEQPLIRKSFSVSHRKWCYLTYSWEIRLI